MPVPACLVDPKDTALAKEACDACKAAVKVKVGGGAVGCRLEGACADSHTRADSCPS